MECERIGFHLRGLCLHGIFGPLFPTIEGLAGPDGCFRNESSIRSFAYGRPGYVERSPRGENGGLFTFTVGPHIRRTGEQTVFRSVLGRMGKRLLHPFLFSGRGEGFGTAQVQKGAYEPRITAPPSRIVGSATIRRGKSGTGFRQVGGGGNLPLDDRRDPSRYRPW